MFLFCAITNSYQGLISDQCIPDAGHGLANAQVGVKLVAVQTRHELGQERSQLLPSLGSNHVKPKSCSLKWGEPRVHESLQQFLLMREFSISHWQVTQDGMRASKFSTMESLEKPSPSAGISRLQISSSGNTMSGVTGRHHQHSTGLPQSPSWLHKHSSLGEAGGDPGHLQPLSHLQNFPGRRREKGEVAAALTLQENTPHRSCYAPGSCGCLVHDGSAVSQISQCLDKSTTSQSLTVVAFSRLTHSGAGVEVD
ncbi:hypothetical protein INR49_030913 [Caranx melampygus]|nr:hypothetical protein INR49_030913 [Caranx melampygus]